MRKLRRQQKREMRGAVRELRHDREFVVREEDAIRAARDVERTAKHKEIMGFLEEQQATFNQIVRKGGGIKKPVDPSEMRPALLNTGKKKADRVARKRSSGHAKGGV